MSFEKKQAEDVAKKTKDVFKNITQMIYNYLKVIQSKHEDEALKTKIVSALNTIEGIEAKQLSHVNKTTHIELKRTLHDLVNDLDELKQDMGRTQGQQSDIEDIEKMISKIKKKMREELGELKDIN